MSNRRPERGPVEWPAEFSVVAFDAIASREFSHSCALDIASLDSSDVLGGGPVAALTADIGEFRCGEFTAVAARFLEADGVAADAIRVGVGFAGDECPKCVGVSRFLPCIVRFCVAHSA